MPKARMTRNSSVKAKLVPKVIDKTVRKPAAKKVVAKRKVSVPKAAPKAVKKAPVAPKRNAKTVSRGGSKFLDLCLILDCTGSMYSWIQRSKDTLHQIIDSVRKENAGLEVRVAFVAYRDV